MVRTAAIAFTLILCSAFAASAEQTTIESDAATAYSQQDWTKAEPLYAQLTQSSADNARFWFRYATAARANGHYDIALQAFEQAKSKGQGKGLPPFLVDYEIAATYAAKGDDSKAFASLDASVKAGYSQPANLESNAAWKSLRADARFPPLLLQAKKNATPCEYTAENRQFDFWLGDWDVVSTQGAQPAGTSHIAREMSGCVIWENWTGNGGGFGKSYNVYNANYKRWEQYWADNSGGVIFFHGNLKDGVMDYWTDDIPQPDGTKLRRHLQFFNKSPDQVRQFSQGSTDEGKTWHVEYDLTYNRRKS